MHSEAEHVIRIEFDSLIHLTSFIKVKFFKGEKIYDKFLLYFFNHFHVNECTKVRN